MKQHSVKLKLTLWLTLLMTVLAGLLLAFMLFIGNVVASQTAMSQLSQTLQANWGQIGMTEGNLSFGDSFSFYRNGVTTLIYSQNEALLAGQIPVSFTAEEPFQSGITRTVTAGEEQYLVLRGLMEAPKNAQLAHNILLVVLLSFPVFLLLVILGSYWIVRRAFRPLEQIMATAEAINEAKDLSRRIALPEGGNEFFRLANTFDQLFGRLERSFEAEKQFTADASHELRTPLSIIKGACEYAEKYDETPEERQETIAMIHRQAVKMSNLIGKLLNMTRLEQGTEPVKLEYVELGGLLQALYEEQRYEQKRVSLKLQENIVVQADGALLSRLAQNLIENGLKYGKPDGQVLVTLLRQQGEILLQVQDDGIGIAAEQQEKVWQRFYQVNPSRSDEKGAGLGLALVQQIAQLHGGYMTLDSTVGVGSTFTLHLPDEETPSA